MNEFEENLKIKADDFANFPSFKENIAVISNINDALYVHSNIFDIKDEEIDINSKHLQWNEVRNDSAFINDITKTTNKLDWDEIKLLKFKILGLSNNLTKEEIKDFQNDIESISSDNISQLVTEDASYGLKIRQKGDKLSKDQLIFIKDLSADPEITTKDIWRVYNVSPSVVNKIKRSTQTQLMKDRIKNVEKLFETRKLKLIKTIDDFIVKNSTTFNAKEVTNMLT